jgi:hypothetical protein
MPTEYEIILKHISKNQWLGILEIDNKEVYRTGAYKSSPVAALTAVQFWMQENF